MTNQSAMIHILWEISCERTIYGRHWWQKVVILHHCRDTRQVSVLCGRIPVNWGMVFRQYNDWRGERMINDISDACWGKMIDEEMETDGACLGWLHMLAHWCRSRGGWERTVWFCLDYVWCEVESSRNGCLQAMYTNPIIICTKDAL